MSSLPRAERRAKTPDKAAPAKSAPPSVKPAKPAAKAPAKPAPTAAKSAPVPVAKPAPAKPAAPAMKAEATAPKPAPKPASKSGKGQPPPAIPPEKDLAVRDGKTTKDQIVLTSPDPYWLHAYWQLSVQSVQRAEAALGQDWHSARPILRLFDVTAADTTSTSEAPVRDIPIHGGCSHWYIDIPQPPRDYRVDIGYITKTGRFWPISRSNIVKPHKAGSGDAVDENWAASLEDMAAERVIAAALRGDHDGRGGKDGGFGSGATLPGRLKKFFFELDAELIVHGKTDPTGSVTLQNEAVKLRPDGTFTMRFSLPDSRQIIPAVATSSDNMEEQTIVLAIERNTKRLDPMIHDMYGDG